ncbi:hypothetical protein VB713_25920 [Anabaena cylindrica UHCC 0172]|uniref:hypothetical protein n=1 Tax=Anabaena cylindrica TaxID=1165 RepID=UPI002B20AB1A|nr:hypothetical protein [Anabaena cylindrica]MEA5554376.1 hypothetical protein [Anabaena cylindrica UHCC 0172]
MYIAPIQSGNLQVHWCGGNVLLNKSQLSWEREPETLLSVWKNQIKYYYSLEIKYAWCDRR